MSARRLLIGLAHVAVSLALSLAMFGAYEAGRAAPASAANCLDGHIGLRSTGTYYVNFGSDTPLYPCHLYVDRDNHFGYRTNCQIQITSTAYNTWRSRMYDANGTRWSPSRHLSNCNNTQRLY
jgi:hypothetical protein